ncbi:hypothetical protein ZOSMA_58G00390 [Zostera marina]|uniref:Uncharacterized protein n=1 Tax=Zostera marina TaxID=29655 RepID=A0A0K9NVC2_ZOSMR|nr:hypothetical protein ZOSMA_58G00390 [Zostera marina]
MISAQSLLLGVSPHLVSWPDFTSTKMAVQVNKKKVFPMRVCCQPISQPIQTQQQQGKGEEEEDAGIMCEACKDQGWLICWFCKGQKTNVKAENNRIYRRCPSCRAVGYLLCSNCKVFKCVTLPDQSD